MKPDSRPLVAIFLLVVSGISPRPVLAAASAEYQTCAPSTLCTVGEFLYDDDYAPIATADCRLTSRDPAGALFINSATMSAQTDGWYSVTVSTASAVGVYRSQVCCTAGTDYLCLDKTFQVVATPSALTASDVWSFSGRSLDDYGTLVADIWANGTRTLSSYGDIASDVWGYSSRSLSGFGTLIADVWNYGTRTITGGAISSVTTNNTTIVTKEDVRAITQSLSETKNKLEQIINKPIVKTSIEENSPSLESKIDRTKNAATRLYAGTTNIKSHVQLLSLQWPILSTLDIQNELTILAQTISEDNDKKDSSVLALSHWLKDAWGNSLTLEISDQVETINSKIDSLKRNLELSGKAGISLTLSPLDSILAHADRLTAVIGDISHSAKEQSLYGFVKRTTELTASLEQERKTLALLLGNWASLPEKEQSQTIASLTTQVMAINQLPNGQNLLENKIKNNKNTLKNKLLSLLALIDTNKIFLTANVGQSIQNVWLEEGSIIFRAVVTNPSKTISQNVPLKYYLPTEVKKEQIIKIDPELTVEYDTAENAFFATGLIELGPEETKTYAVEVEDIWAYSEEVTNAYKKQTGDLLDPLKNTSFFAQGASLKSDITVTLEKIMARQKQAAAPEARIRAYRESALEMVGVEEKILALKQLVSQAGSTGSIFGFVGGIQSVAVWGLIIIFVSGFVFLASYMRALRFEQSRLAVSITPPGKIGKPAPSAPTQTTPQTLKKTTISRARQLTKTIIIVLLTSSFFTLGSSLIVASARKNNLSALVSPLDAGLILGQQAPTDQK